MKPKWCQILQTEEKRTIRGDIKYKKYSNLLKKKNIDAKL